MLRYVAYHAQREEKKREMEKGYPITSKPREPHFMHLAEDKQLFTLYEHPEPMLKLTYAAVGTDVANAESLEMIRKKLLSWFNKYPEIQKEIENPFPNNTLAVSFSQMNFQIGDGPQEFRQFDSFAVSPTAYYTYQKLSDSLHRTLYNENGIEYLAGITFYPAPQGSPKFLNTNGFLYNWIQCSAEYYPQCDRKITPQYTKFNQYGRYCNEAGKRVLVKFNPAYDTVCHTEFNHRKNKYVLTPCAECKADHTDYKWIEPKKEVSVTTVSEVPVGSSQPKPSKDVVPTSKKLSPLEILESAGITLQLLLKLKDLDQNIKISMVHKNTKEVLAEKKKPELSGLLLFVMLNPDWKIDVDNEMLVNENSNALDETVLRMCHRSTGVELENAELPKVSDLAKWLDENPEYNVHQKHALIAQLTLGCEYEDRIGSDSSVFAVSDEISDLNLVRSDEVAESVTNSTSESSVSDFEEEDEVSESECSAQCDNQDEQINLHFQTSDEVNKKTDETPLESNEKSTGSMSSASSHESVLEDLEDSDEESDSEDDFELV
ncbi:hypothetical protein CRE_14196 [Caenorhabditis remanei]|uniref:BRK domain-containing protein n=1 Tax=Caenorhabditis remanei TaxID=31234 RepID=E3N1L5_CAERE|nr:hypothetical protein CRE_14196 [Caenorhabditis remanei]